MKPRNNYRIQVEQPAADCVPEHVGMGTEGWVHMSLLSEPRIAVLTATPLPTPTPGPMVFDVNQTQQIGPIWNESRDETYSTAITLQKVLWATESGYSEPKTGFVYVVVYVRVTNNGPDMQRSVYTSDFEVKTGSGSLLGDNGFLDLVDDCDLDLVDLVPGGSVEGCIAYEVPETGRLDLVFAPYQYDSFGAGRYLSFNLRP